MTEPSADDSAHDVVVINKETASRYEVHVDGELAGLTNYRVHGDRVDFTHAEVYPRWEGQGVGSALARWALDDVIAHGKLITPSCPFIADYVQHHPAYLEHVDSAHRAKLEDLT